MSYKTNLRTVLKNINEKNIGTVNIEISFINKESKRKIRRYLNTNQLLHKDNFTAKGIKTKESLKKTIFLVDKKKQEIADVLQRIEIEHGKVSPEIYDNVFKVSTDSKKDIIELIDQFLEHKQRTVDVRTVKKYKSLKNTLKKFIDAGRIKKIYMSDITKKFLNEFTFFLSEKQKLNVTTINKYQSNFNTFMDFLTHEIKINKNLAYKEFKKVPRKKNSESKVVLLKEHVEKLINWKPTEKRLEVVRDLFLIQIFTGIRYGDLERFNKSFIQNDRVTFIMFKTTTRVNIPVHPNLDILLRKYDYDIGKKCKTIKNYNVDLKTVAELAGLKENVASLKIKLNSKISQETPLFKLVSSHVGRTTFVTNCLISGISPYIVMSFTGHSKIETLTYYMKIAGDMTQDAFKRFEDYFSFAE